MVGLLLAETPAKPKKSRAGRPKTVKSSTTTTAPDNKKRPLPSKDTETEAELPPPKIPKQFRYLDRSRGLGEKLFVWNDQVEESEELQVVSHRETANPLTALPVPASRPAESRNKISYAAQTFNMPELANMSGFIAGE